MYESNNISNIIRTKREIEKEYIRYTWFTQVGYIHRNIAFYYLQKPPSILQENNSTITPYKYRRML
jgi:hypothetical protein